MIRMIKKWNWINVTLVMSYLDIATTKDNVADSSDYQSVYGGKMLVCGEMETNTYKGPWFNNF